MKILPLSAFLWKGTRPKPWLSEQTLCLQTQYRQIWRGRERERKKKNHSATEVLECKQKTVICKCTSILIYYRHKKDALKEQKPHKKRLHFNLPIQNQNSKCLTFFFVANNSYCWAQAFHLQLVFLIQTSFFWMNHNLSICVIWPYFFTYREFVTHTQL